MAVGDVDTFVLKDTCLVSLLGEVAMSFAGVAISVLLVVEGKLLMARALVSQSKALLRVASFTSARLTPQILHRD